MDLKGSQFPEEDFHCYFMCAFVCVYISRDWGEGSLAAYAFLRVSLHLLKDLTGAC